MKQIKLIWKDINLNGILINEESNFITIKLKSGYNILLDKKDIKILETTNINENINFNRTKFKEKKNNELPNILILHTGGTIASKVDYETGAVSSKIKPEELLNLYPELINLANIHTKFLGNIFSEDIRFCHYNLMLNEIKKNTISIKDLDGIIISHGTDTMHYSATALFYGLENLNLPVLLVGAQRSSDRPSSDAFTNLKAAIKFIEFNKKLKNKEKMSFNRVGICMHKDIKNDDEFLILDSINSKKMHSSRRDAFKQINFEPVCEINKNEIKIIRKNLFTSFKKSEKLKINLYNENLKIGIFKSHPNLNHQEIKMLNYYDGIIIEGTGLGNLPVDSYDNCTKENELVLKELDYLINKLNKKVIISTQTNYGIVNLNVYSSGRKILKTNILGNLSKLISETLFIRLAFCLSKNSNNFESCWKKNLEKFIQ